MRLHMSSNNPFSKDKTFIMQSGFIADVTIYENEKQFKDGFHIQLMYRNSELYYDTEKFFGNFKEFTITERNISYILKVEYNDGSYFEIEVFM
jgi:hypothetical protein